MSSSRTGPPLRVAPSGLFSWLPLWSSPLLLFSLQVPLFLPAHRVTTSRSACLELRGHDSMFPPSRCAIRGHASFTRGNTDRYVVTGDLPVQPEKALEDPALLPKVIEAARSFSWTRGYVSAAGWLDWLTNLPLEVRLTLPDGTRLLGVHASPGRDDGPGIQSKHSDGKLEQRLAGCEADLVIVRLAGYMSSIWAASAIWARRASRLPMCFLMPT